MQTFHYVIQDPIGIHARPAGILVKKAKEFQSKCILFKADENWADLTKLLAVMGLGVKQGDHITVQTEGVDEEQAAKELARFFREHL